MIRWTSLVFTSLAAATAFGLTALLAWQSVPVWNHAGFEWITGTTWSHRHQLFGALPMIHGTVVVAAVALGFAAPLGIGAAIFSAELAPTRLRLAVKITIELLAGIPSVVYGLLGILFLRNWIYHALEPFDPLSGDTLLTAGLLLGIMILPTIMTLCDDSLRAVPRSLRMASRGLGLTRTETILSVTLPHAARGIAAALLLGLGRAMGETIAVFLVVGRQDNQWPQTLLSLRPLMEPGQTLTSKLGSSETHIAYGDPLHWGAITGLALLVLLLVTGIVLAASIVLSDRHDAPAR